MKVFNFFVTDTINSYAIDVPIYLNTLKKNSKNVFKFSDKCSMLENISTDFRGNFSQSYSDFRVESWHWKIRNFPQ